ncbi:hypothetical protein HDU76_005576 [Blyttiomyces sp. JEL0837]|nr:hypothetical protein HDU76_005576 [Blyttiomyces sp. JEL0837]
MSNNNLSGTIPVSFGKLKHLSAIDSSSNSWNGSIPTAIGDATSLVTINLSNNSLTGGIPPTFGKLRHLSAMNLAANRLSGTVPASLASCRNLSSLILTSNELSGNLPASVLALGIQNLQLQSNCVSGKVPLGGSQVDANGCTKPTPTVSTTPKPAKTVNCFPKSMASHLQITQTHLPTPNIYGVNGDFQNGTCNSIAQAMNTHCYGTCIVQCAGHPWNAWRYLECQDGYMCRKVGRSRICALPPSRPKTFNGFPPPSPTQPALPAYSGMTVPTATTSISTTEQYQVPPPQYTPPPQGVNQCISSYIPSTGPNQYGQNGDADGASCDTEAQVNNTHCAGPVYRSTRPIQMDLSFLSDWSGMSRGPWSSCLRILIIAICNTATSKHEYTRI